MVKSIVRFHHWKPSDIDELYMDSLDHHGLFYWYQDVKDYNKQLEKSVKK